METSTEWLDFSKITLIINEYNIYISLSAEKLWV